MFPELIFEEACEAFRQKNYGKAERGFRIVLSQEPAHAPSLYFLGQIAMDRGAGESAVNLFYEAYTAEPKNQDYIYALAVALQETGHADEAVSYYKKISEWSSVQNAMGLIYQAQGNMDKARRAFHQAVKKDEKNAHALTNLAVLEVRVGRLSQAQTYLTKALKYDPQLGNAHMLSAQISLQRGDMAAARKRCATGLKQVPDYAPLWQMLGHIYEKEGHLAKALSAFQDAVRLDPYNETLLFDRGEVLEQLNQSDAAEQSYRDCLRLNPSFAPAINKLAILLHKRGVSIEALELYRQLIRENPNDCEAILNMAVIVSDAGDYETAAGLFVLLLSKHTYEPQAHEALAKLLPEWAKQDKKQAGQYALGWAKNFPDNALAKATYAKLFDKADKIG